MSDRVRTVRCDDVDLRCVDTGARPDGGPVLLLVHGFPLSRSMWRRQVADLGAEFRVLAPDLRGHGESPMGDWPADAEPSLDRHADDLATLLDALAVEGPVVFAGFSMGGYIAWSFLRRHAERVGALALIDTKAAADDETARANRLRMADSIDEWGARRVAEMMTARLFAPGVDAATVAEVTEVIGSTATASIAASQRAMAARPDATPRLASLDTPTLVVVGEDDQISTPAEMRAIADAIPNAEFVSIAGAGHMAPVERPDAVNAALRAFLRRLGTDG